MDKNIQPEATPQKPGVSGKERGKKPWINLKELNEQEDFVDKNEITPVHSVQNDNYSDEKLNETITMALKRNPETDLENVSVKVSHRDVALTGHVQVIKEFRAIEAVVRNIPGVREVFNSIEVQEKN